MKRCRYLIPLVIAGGLVITGCAPEGPKQTGGALIGAVVGGVLGSKVGKGSGRAAAIGLGTLSGALLGSEIGKSLDRADRLAMAQTTRNALEEAPSGYTSTWRNPDSGNSGTITPKRTYYAANRQPCREYTQTVTIGGNTEQAYGRACRQADGSWKIVN